MGWGRSRDFRVYDRESWIPSGNWQFLRKSKLDVFAEQAVNARTILFSNRFSGKSSNQHMLKRLQVHLKGAEILEYKSKNGWKERLRSQI